MDFDPGLKIGEEINNNRLCEIFYAAARANEKVKQPTHLLLSLSMLEGFMTTGG